MHFFQGFIPLIGSRRGVAKVVLERQPERVAAPAVLTLGFESTRSGPVTLQVTAHDVHDTVQALGIAAAIENAQ